MNNCKFIDDIIDNYYKNIGNSYKSALKLGQIVWTFFLYGYEILEFWRPDKYDDTCTKVISFKICSSVSDAFNRQIPLISPRLEIDEEFIKVKAKKRPAVVIAPPPQEISMPEVRGGGKINLKICILAPLVSIENKYGKTKYQPDFVNRIRKLEYPHFFFLPEFKEENIRNSLCRFDRIFSNFRLYLEPVDLCLYGEAFDVFISQLKCYLTRQFEGYYKIAHEILSGGF